MYVSYDYYTESFGGSIPEEDFAKVEAASEAAISYLTYLNGDIFAAEDDRVKRAVCAAAEVIYNSEKSSGSGKATGAAAIKSESNDGYSVTYVTEVQDGQTAEAALRKKVAEAVRVYLLPTGWLSRKVGCCHVCTDGNHNL